MTVAEAIRRERRRAARRAGTDRPEDGRSDPATEGDNQSNSQNWGNSDQYVGLTFQEDLVYACRRAEKRIKKDPTRASEVRPI